MNMYIGLVVIIICFFILFIHNMKNLIINHNKKIFDLLLSLKEFPVFYTDRGINKEDLENIIVISQELELFDTALSDVKNKTEKQKELKNNIVLFKGFINEVSENLKLGKVIDSQSSEMIKNIKQDLWKIKKKWSSSLSMCFLIHTLLFTIVFLAYMHKMNPNMG